MGSCFSIINRDVDESESQSLSTAKIISAEGTLRDYSIPTTVSQVLQMEEASTSTFFLCNSDQLYYDDYIKPLGSNEELRVGQIYFVLPMSRLKYRLTASDMAALAVKASSALTGRSSNSKKSNNNGRSGRNKKKIRISPVLDLCENGLDQSFDHEVHGFKRFEKPVVMEMKRSGSVRKLQRNASKRAKLAIRSFRLKLNTIYEE